MGLAFRDRIVASGRPETYPFRLPLSWAARLSFVRAGLRLRTAAQEHVRAARLRPGETPAARRARVLAHRDDQTFAAYLGDLHPDVGGDLPGHLGAGHGRAGADLGRLRRRTVRDRVG